jgi:hypothetical protein
MPYSEAIGVDQTDPAVGGGQFPGRTVFLFSYLDFYFYRPLLS